MRKGKKRELEKAARKEKKGNVAKGKNQKMAKGDQRTFR
jgi:hypothetical protein